MTPPASAWIVTLFLLPYVIAVDLLVGGLAVSLHARWRGATVHRALRARMRRALPAVLYAVAVSGVGALTIIRSSYPGAEAIGWVGMRDGTRVPALAHLLLAACAVTGTAVALAARHAGGIARTDGRALARYGAGWGMFCTLGNLLVGVLWMLRLPHETALRFTGADTGAMLVFSVAVTAAVLSLGFLAMSLTVPGPSGYLDAGAVGLFATLVAMVWMREVVRGASPAAMPTWTALAFAGVLALIALAALRGAWRAFARP
jgi:hypothetical protein